MPKYNKALLTEQAKQHGFLTASYEKMSRLTDILKFINETDELKNLLALKGGTAINLTVFNLPRLSVDIDLDFTENLTKEETRAKRDRVNELLERYMTVEGYAKHVKSKHTHILDSHVYSYSNVAGNLDNIKVEINYSLRAHALPAVIMTARSSGVSIPFPIRTLAPVEIFASKIVALCNRAAARDLYDLSNMIYYDLFDETNLELLRKVAVFYLAVAGDVTLRGFSAKRIASITAYKIRTELRPMLRSTERFDLQAAHDRVSAFLVGWMALTESETEFLSQFAKGEYKPQFLFEDSEIVKRVENHPMVLWRIRHIRDGQK